MLTTAGESVTVATAAGGGAVTVNVAVPLTLPTVARIVLEPALIPVATPVVDTVAIAVDVELHETVRPVMLAPDASRAVAANVVVAPTVVVAVTGLIVTEATAMGAVEPVAAFD